MKTFFFLLMLFILASCESESPILNHLERPFIVKSIKRFDNTHSYYTSRHMTEYAKNSSTVDYVFTMPNNTVILPTGWYNINDTIILIPKKLCK